MRFLLLLSFLSCSTASILNNKEESFNFSDVSGSYHLFLNTKISGKKVITQRKLLDLKTKETLEKTYILSKVDHEKNIWIPIKTQSILWIDKEEKLSEFKVLKNKKSYQLRTKESKLSHYKFIDSKVICSFSQITICAPWFIKKNKDKVLKGKKLKLGVLWDQFPYTETLYSSPIETPLAISFINLESIGQDSMYFTIDISNNMLSLVLDKSYNFKSFHWVAQGLSIELE